jgi:hypothetical protein
MEVHNYSICLCAYIQTAIYGNLPIEHEKMRPDYTVDVYQSYDYGYMPAFGEIKPENASDLVLFKYFYAFCLFAKIAIQSHYLSMCLFFKQQVKYYIYIYYIQRL